MSGSATLSRRTLLRSSAFAALLGGAAPVVAAAPARAQSAPDLRAFAADDQELHLLRRATFGLTPKSVNQMRTLGVEAWLDQQLDPATINDDRCAELIATRFPGVSWTIPQALANLEDFSWDLMFDLGVATLARAAWSKRQLFEVMCDFWDNHLNVTNPSDHVWAVRHDYENRVIREHALGSYKDMLRAAITHPAMLLYLNNADSSKWSPNENLGRELLELHSVGVGGGYDEADMRTSALILTGLSIGWDTYEFRYRQTWHHTGPVQVMDWSHANATAEGGLNVALAYVDYLAHHPSTATRLATKLCRRFVADEPPATLVSALAATYLANDTAIRPVLRQLFTSAEFAGSIGQKVRRPMEFQVATVRALGIKADINGSKGMRGLYWMLQDLGQPPMGWSQPNGYPDEAVSWRSAGGTLARWNCSMSLAAHWWPKELILPPLRKLLPKTLPPTYGALVDTLAQRLVFTPLEPGHRDAVLAFIGKNAGTRPRETDDALKWRLPYLVSLILDSPYQQVR